MHRTRTPRRRALLGVALAAGALVGETDHGASFSLYINDPDGNELEIFWLLPREEWDRKPATRELKLAEKVKERTAATV